MKRKRKNNKQKYRQIKIWGYNSVLKDISDRIEMNEDQKQKDD